MTRISNELAKNMFAEFGLAYCDSEALCRELGIFYTLMSFRDAKDITQPRIAEKLAETSYLTLGQIIGKVSPLVSLDLQTRLAQILETRNYLAHQFWNEHGYAMLSEEGLMEMIIELRQYRRVFDEIDREVQKLRMLRSEEIGVTDEIVADHLRETLAGEIELPLSSKRPITKSMLRIIRAYDIRLDNNRLTNVFETEDGQFLQFCDVGLGWSNFTEVQSNWEINEELQQYLPANVVPRPQISDPWNYEFKLPQNRVLWVKKGNADKTYKWGIRAEEK